MADALANRLSASFPNLWLNTEWPRLVQDADTWQSKVREHAPALPLYEQRLRAIVDICRKNGIDPVFITQPALFGNAVDPTTGIDLATLNVYDRNSGALEWLLLDQMNGVTRRVAEAHGSC